MRWEPSVGHFNIALVAIYVVPLFGLQAVQALTSQVYGLDQPDMLAVATFYRQAFDLDPGGLAAVASTLAGIKLVIASLFLAVLVDFLRGIQSEEGSDGATIDAALLFGAIGIAAWAIPAYYSGSTEVFRLHATHVLMVAGAVVLVAMERLLPRSAPVAEGATWSVRQQLNKWWQGREFDRLALPPGRLASSVEATGVASA